jgi:SPRY domain
MTTATSFAYNAGTPITGTTQVGNLAVGTPTSGFTNSPQFWNGPDEELGYVIAAPVSGNTQQTPVFGGNLTLSPTYKGTDITLVNSQSALQQFGYQQSVLGQTLINNVDKVMFSVQSNVCPSTGNPFFQSIGIGTTSMNYQGNPYGAYPGNDNQSVGFSMDGNFYYNGSIVQSALPTWSAADDLIDVAVDLSNGLIWIRVNGYSWNNNPFANPAIGVGGLSLYGLTSFYPVLSPGNDNGQMTILNSPYFLIPEGYQVLGDNVNASLKFYGTKNMPNPFNESTFVELVNTQFNQSFTTGNDASTWLTTNGYWNSWVSITPTPTATIALTPTPTPSVTTTQTPTITPTPTPTSGASGNFNVTVSQVGSDVVWNGSGSFNLAALTSEGPGNIGGGYSANQAIWAIGPDVPVDTYSGTITYPSTFGGGGVAVTSNAGSTFGILPGGSGRLLYVPSGYVTNTNINGSSTYVSQTIAGMGLTPGVYTWSWGTGGNTSTLVMTIN